MTTNIVRNTFKKTSRLAELWADLLSDPVPPRPAARLEGRDPGREHPSLPGSYAPDRFPDAASPVTRIWKNSLEMAWHTLIELENPEPGPLSMGQANSEPDALSDTSIEAAHEEALALISPFRWDPRPAWTNTPVQHGPPLSNAAVPPVTRPKIPLRPLHKRPFYKRFFFYLHHWLSKPK